MTTATISAETVKTAFVKAPEKLNTIDAAAYVGAQPATLETWRCNGGGPAFIKVGRKVWYLRVDLDAWMQSRRVTCTSQIN